MNHRTTFFLLLATLLAMHAAAAPAKAGWTVGAPMPLNRTHHTATLLASGRVLVAGGVSTGTGQALSSTVLYDPATGTWETAAPLHVARSSHTATFLPSGKVIVVGGWGQNALNSAELYDPLSDTWETIESLYDARFDHTATLLPSGDLLVVAGRQSQAPSALASAEIYIHREGWLRTVNPLPGARFRHVAALLPSGQVLVAGGQANGTFLGTAAIYNPSDQTWIDAGSFPPSFRFALIDVQETLTLLPSGNVLKAGGSSTEIYDPVSGSWNFVENNPPNPPIARPTATLLPSGEVLRVGDSIGITILRVHEPHADLFDEFAFGDSGQTWIPEEPPTLGRVGHSATLLPSGKVLVLGKDVGDPSMGTEIYTPAEHAEDSSSLFYPRRGHTATLLASGKILMVGGELGLVALPPGISCSAAELYDPATATAVCAAPLDAAPQDHSATLLTTGEVLVAGGSLGSALVYVPEDGLSGDSWEFAGTLSVTRRGHTATLLPSGRVLVTGGGEDELPGAELYDHERKDWQPTADPPEHRARHTATLLPSGHVLVAGGVGATGSALSSAEIYDPVSDTWEGAGALEESRSSHTATLLPSGRVLVVGGAGGSASSEIYDPATRRWERGPRLARSRTHHTATLLPGGTVLVAGGDSADTLSPTDAVEIYHPSVNRWQTLGLTLPRARHQATLLATGGVLISGGRNSCAIDCVLVTFSSTIILYPEGVSPHQRDGMEECAPRCRPRVLQHSPDITYTAPLVVSGKGFRGDSEAGTGNTQSSAVNHPLVRIRPLAGGPGRYLVPEPRPGFADDLMTIEVSRLPALRPGPHLLSVVTAGVPSEPVVVDVHCGVEILRDPRSVTIPANTPWTFSVEARGARRYQWYRDDGSGPFAIPGADGPSFTTPLVAAMDSGTRYWAEADAICDPARSLPAVSGSAVLTIEDQDPPHGVEVLAPNGGEFWLLSQEGEAASTELVTWQMGDDVRICRVRASLLFFDEVLQEFVEAPAAGGLPVTFGDGGACTHPGENTTSTLFTVPTVPPSGTPGSLYKVRVEVTDHAGNPTRKDSARPFFIVQPNDTSVKTLIVHHASRLTDDTALRTDLEIKLQELADHPQVQGRLVDLGEITTVNELYRDWDENPDDPLLANQVLFGPGGVQDVLRDRFEAFTGVEYLVLVGGDHVVPMARIPDGGALFDEENYTEASGTVGDAIAGNYYLSDDPISRRAKVEPEDLLERDTLLLPDVAVGRLVETPDEIIASIATFLSQDGGLDLSQKEEKVLVTGYDFLVDAGRRIHQRWDEALGAAAVDGDLLSTTWDVSTVAERRTQLEARLHEGYAIVNLNGHATHFEAGVPGTGIHDIQGLDVGEIHGSQGPELSGSLVYAVGCHGGLPVEGSKSGGATPSLDLPQTLLDRGAMAYVANTGYGWGLRNGVGLSERLVEIFTEELTSGGPNGNGVVVVGDLVRRSKERYFDESPLLDAYDQKTLMQWATFGFPMYSLDTGIVPAPSSKSEPVVVERRERPKAGLPSYLTRLDLRFDLTADGVYTKHGADGQVLPEGGLGCPDPAGCYYTLNGLSDRATGEADLPIQPYFVYRSSLSGTVQHGILWMGGSYEEETGWTPVIGELVTNGGDGSDHGSTPRTFLGSPRGPHRRKGSLDGEPEGCRAVGSEIDTVVLTTGEALKARATDSRYTLQRLHREVELEVLYFNNTSPGHDGNCDRTGPSFEDGAFHTTEGRRVDFAVPVVSADGGVWRVIVVYDDTVARRWRPLELEDADGDGVWRGSLEAPGSGRLTYYLQAVDRRGNVSWLEFDQGTPASGVNAGIPRPVDVDFVVVGLIFSDGFESGNTAPWSGSTK